MCLLNIHSNSTTTKHKQNDEGIFLIVQFIHIHSFYNNDNNCFYRIDVMMNLLQGVNTSVHKKTLIVIEFIKITYYR